MSGDVARIDDRPGADLVDATDATRELAAEFARALSAGERSAVESLLAETVAALVSGRGPAAGRHDGRTAVLDALFLTGRPDASIDAAEVAEVLADGRRALVVVAQSGTVAGRPVAWETAFHLQTDGERVAGITEYSGDQAVADEVVVAPPAESASNERRWWRWRGRVRRGGG